MKKLEKLKGKVMQKHKLSLIYGSMLAPDYTNHSTHCTDSGTHGASDCEDGYKDKDK